MIGYRREPPEAVVNLLRANESALFMIVSAREMATTTLAAERPYDCSEERWASAIRGLRRFMRDGWGDQAALLGWTAEELYRVPPVWRRVDLTGAALLIGEGRVIAATENSIVFEKLSGSRLKFRRIGREHVT
jgi:hypothetical protein